MRYATGHAFSTSDIFRFFNIKRLKCSAKLCEKLIGSRHKEDLAARVFCSAVRLIIDDIIHNGVRFVLPTRKMSSHLQVERINEDEFIRARKNGAFQDVDFLRSNFTANRLMFTYQSQGVIHKKHVYVDANRKNILTEYTNNGKQYY